MSNSFTRFVRRLQSGQSAHSSIQTRPSRHRLMVGQLEPRLVPALIINPTFAANIQSDPNAAKIESTINTAIQAFQNSFSDNVTLNVMFEEGAGLGGSTQGFYSGGSNETYSSVLAALKARASTAADASALASLPAGSANPVGGGSDMKLNPGLEKLYGFLPNPAVGDAPDATVTLNTAICNLDRLPGDIDPNKYDLLAVTAHELDEVLSGGSALDGSTNGAVAPQVIEPLDFFRYSAQGVRSYTTAASNVANAAYFSIDAGKTDLANFNQTGGGDFGDWFSDGPHTPQIQDAFSSPAATPNLNVEFVRLDVLGYTPIARTAPVVTAAATQTATAGVATQFNLGSFAATKDGPWGVDVNWGDGSPHTTFYTYTAGSLGTASHTYANNGGYAPTVTVTDFTSLSGAKSFAVNVGATGVASTSTQVASSASTAVFGQAVTFTATVANTSGGATPTGTVQFVVDNVNFGSPVALDSTGHATSASTTFLSGSSHAVKAVYIGNAKFTTSNGTLNQTVQTIAVEADPLTAGRSALFIGSNGAASNDTIQIDPVGGSLTGSTGVKVTTLINGVSTQTTYGQSFSTLFVYLQGGNDSITMASSLTINSVVTAGNGKDAVTLGNGKNKVTLGNGDDTYIAGSGSNTLVAGNGNDYVKLPSDGHNNITLGNGNDTVIIGNGNNQIVKLGNGNNTVTIGTGGLDVVTLGTGSNNVTIGDGSNNTVTAPANSVGVNTVKFGKGTNNVFNKNGGATIAGHAVPLSTDIFAWL